MEKFNYCLLVWTFSSASLLRKTGRQSKGRAKVNVDRLKILYTEVYETINNFNPNFIKDLFSFKESSKIVQEKYMLNLKIPVHTQVMFGSKSLRVLVPNVRNSLPYHIKPSEKLVSFKMIIKHWNRTRCNSKVCNS